MTIPNFRDLTSEQRTELCSAGRSTKVLLASGVANVGDLSKAFHPSDKPEYAEIPPTANVLSDKEARRVYTRTNDVVQSRWLGVIQLVYRLGGRVLYRHIDADTVEALIDFREPREGDLLEMSSGARPIVLIDEHWIEVCSQSECVPSAIVHDHVRINRGLLVWNSEGNIWHLPRLSR